MHHVAPRCTRPHQKQKRFWHKPLFGVEQFFTRGGFVGLHTGSLRDVGNTGYYWSSTASTSASNAYRLVFYAGDIYPSNSLERWRGFSVRCMSGGSYVLSFLTEIQKALQFLRRKSKLFLHSEFCPFAAGGLISESESLILPAFTVGTGKQLLILVILLSLSLLVSVNLTLPYQHRIAYVLLVTLSAV